jgi:hypothetical protein
MSNARQNCRDIIKNMVPPDLWEKNHQFTAELHNLIRGHQLMRHSLLGQLQNAQLSPANLKRMHHEFRYTFAQIFTDSLIHAMYQAVTLEPRYGALGKVSARFMLQYNVLDELGFLPGTSDAYGGSPQNAHYVQFEKTLGDLGASREEILNYKPSDAAVALRRIIEASYGDYQLLLAMLAVAETVFDDFAGAWAKNVSERTTVNTQDGYHAIHVEHDGASLDHLHSEDLWYVLCQGLEPSRYAELRSKVSEYLDALVRFADYIVSP